MGIGSYAGGINRGIQNGVNISLALRADKRAEANQKIGIQRQEKADSRADTLYAQSQEDRDSKSKVDALNSRLSGYALKLSSFGSIDDVDSQTLTGIYKQEGMFDDLAKPNQVNFHIADYSDGKTKGKVIQFNQKDENGNLITNKDGSPKWFSVTEGRGTTDNGVVMPAGYMVSNAFAKMVGQGADGKAALSLYDKKLGEREKLALQHQYKLEEKKLGVGAKPTYKTDADGNTFAIIGNEAVPVQVPSSNETIQQRQMNAQADALAQGVPETLVRPANQFDVPRTDVLQQAPKKAFTDKVISDETGNERIVRVYDDPNKPAEYINAPTSNATAETPPIQGAQKAPDGKWYIERNGKYFEVAQ